jgi:hypothetical protein
VGKGGGAACGAAACGAAACAAACGAAVKLCRQAG